VITGALPAERALGLVDRDGLTMAEALRHAGRRPNTIGPDPEALRRVGSFVELHIEQGRGLVDLGQPVAIGTHIWPHGRWRLDFPGEANHAGTTAMAQRRDAMIPLAEAVLVARRAALAEGCVATIGRIEVRPGGVNVVPGSATAWLDARDAEEDAVRRTVAAVAAMTETADGIIREESWTPVTHFDSELIKQLKNVLPDAPHLGTGAGHDAGILADAGIPAAMIFVRNPTGVSHSPAEFAEREDCLAGVDALADVLRALAGDAP
jgi:N-carbamoyl-L-amino-acid hydrolase